MTQLRPYVVAVELVLLAVAAYFGAHTLNQLLAAAIAPTPVAQRGGQATAVPAAAAARTMKDYREIYRRDIFHADREPAREEEEAPAGRRSDLRLRLWGTAVCTGPESYAVIEDLDTSVQQVYRRGEELVKGVVLDQVEWDHVVLKRDGDREVLPLEPAEGSPADGAAAPSTPWSPAGGAIRKVGNNQFLVARGELERARQNLTQLLTQARALPHFENGQTVGWRVFAIHKGSLFERIGLQNGDIVRRVNGIDLSDPAKALRLLDDLASLDSVTVDLERGSAAVTLSYDIR